MSGLLMVKILKMVGLSSSEVRRGRYDIMFRNTPLFYQKLSVVGLSLIFVPHCLGFPEMAEKYTDDHLKVLWDSLERSRSDNPDQ